MEEHSLHVIAHLQGMLPEKFGIPRQSGLAPTLQAKIVFVPEFRNEDALRGLEGFSHLWLIWQFSESVGAEWSPTVRPPRLGGNKRLGVFATRSPFRPNPLGLSCVRLERIEKKDGLGTVLCVSGADLMDGTPIYDIKPYLPYADCHPEATGGFASVLPASLAVVFPEEEKTSLSKEETTALREILSQDPRPPYHNDSTRVYGLRFGAYDVRFRVESDTVYVTEIAWHE